MEQSATLPYFPLDELKVGFGDFASSPARKLWHHRTAEVARFIGRGYLHVTLLMLSLLFVGLTTLVRRRQTARVSPQVKSSLSKASIVLEILVNLTRGGAVAFSFIEVLFERGYKNLPETILLLAIFVVGVFRVSVVPATSPWRSRLLHQINALQVGALVLSAAEILAPIVILDNPLLPTRLALCKLFCIFASVAVAFVTPRQWTPPAITFDLIHRGPDDGSSPEETCSWFSYLFYGWLNNTLILGYKNLLDFSNILPLPYYDEPLIWLNTILTARERWRSTFKTMMSVLKWEIARMAFFGCMCAFVEFIAPVAMYSLLHYLERPAEAIVHPGVWVVLLFVGPMWRSTSLQQYLFASTRLIVRTKISLAQELYSKALRSVNFDSSVEAKEERNASVQTDAVEKKSAKTGTILNLMSYDVDSLYGSRDLVYVTVTTPIEITMAVLILYKLLSWASLVGLTVLLCSFPLAAFLSKQLSKTQKQVMIATDKRIALVSEYLSSIRTIKYFAWEESMSKNILDARAEEQRWIWRRNLYSAAIMVSGDFTPLITLFIMFITFTLGTGNQLSAAVAFTSLSVVEVLRAQFVWISNVTRFYAQGTISCQRIDKYFETAVDCQRHQIGPPAFRNATFRRTPISDFRLHNLNVEFLEGKLNIIMGPSACGKSSLLLSLIGETILESGEASCPQDVAYASQSAWLMNETIQANIIFYQPFEKVRYDAVIEACGLTRDFAAMENGDLTKAGEAGSSLSGGQKQRIALARCFYSKSPLLLLDDIFSALDVETAGHIWKHAFRGDLVEGRTVILVTQQSWLAEEADLAITMQAGEIIAVEHHDHSGKTPLETPHISGISTPISAPKPAPSLDNAQKTNMAALNQELSSLGRNERTMFYKYMYLFGGGHAYAIFCFIIAASAQIAFFSVTLWLSVWVGQYSKDEAVNVGFYLAVYGGILFTFTILSISKDLTFRWGAWNAAKTLHNSMVKSIMSVSLDWFDTNPVGRVINRFSSDMTSMDLTLLEYLRAATDNALRLVLRIGGIGSIMPIFAIPAAFVCSIGFAVGEIYSRAQLPVKKMFSASNSPIFSQFQDTMTGLSVIRARGMQDVFSDLLARRLRTYARTAETLFNLNRWVSIRADCSAAVVAFMAGLLAIYKSGSVSPGLVGFSLTNAIGLSTTIIYLVRNMNELEIELNCFHRVREYMTLPPEESPDFIPDPRMPSNSANQAVIEFRNVTARYSDDGPDVLKNVSFKIKAGERIAIIGRTGSGKSTTALCLLRFVHISSGQILIDGLDITKIDLSTLRREVTMIPQEPILFSGTVRTNLDPTNTIPEEVIVHSLEACNTISAIAKPHKQSTSTSTSTDSTLVSTSSSSSSSSIQLPTPNNNTPTSRIQLSTHISAKGENLSQGERQILGVARAISRQSKIVLLDEATASVDYESDKAIQEVLRKEFEGKTVITIAHRLRTIVDYDRVMVLSAGEVVEIGAPKELWGLKGRFWELVGQSAERGELIEFLEG